MGEEVNVNDNRTNLQTYMIKRDEIENDSKEQNRNGNIDEYINNISISRDNDGIEQDQL